ACHQLHVGHCAGRQESRDGGSQMLESAEISNEFYVMPAFVTLAVRDLQASAQWYQDVLNFRTLFEVPGQLVHLRREKYQDILLKPGVVMGEERSVRTGAGVSLCYSVGAPADVDRLA